MQFSKDVAVIAKYFRQQRNQYVEPFGLKGLHARMLIDVCEHSGLSQDGLAQRMRIDKSNVARQVAVLEENGFLLRKPSGEDKRVMCLYPTQKTLELLPGLQEETERWEHVLLGVLTPGERIQLLELLHRVRTRIEGEE